MKDIIELMKQYDPFCPTIEGTARIQKAIPMQPKNDTGITISIY